MVGSRFEDASRVYSSEQKITACGAEIASTHLHAEAHPPPPEGVSVLWVCPTSSVLGLWGRPGSGSGSGLPIRYPTIPQTAVTQPLPGRYPAVTQPLPSRYVGR